MKRVLGWMGFVLLLPFIQMQNLYRYSQTREGRAAKITTFILFIPILALTVAIWAMLWLLVIEVYRRLFGF